MSLRFNKVGEVLKGFAIASRKGVFGEVETKVDPNTLCDFVDYKSYSYILRYVCNVPLLIFYADFVAPGTQRSVQGDDLDDIVLGDVIIFGMDDGVRGLTDFEIALVKDNITMEKSNQINHLVLNNVSKDPRPLTKEVSDE